MVRIRLLLPYVVAALAGCGGTAPGGVVVRDSAGVQVVTSTRPAWGARPRSAEAEATVELGSGTHSGGPRLEDVRAAVRLSSGEIVVADGGSQRLLWYDRRGRYLRATGGGGSGGPGEVASGDALVPFGARGVLAWDGSGLSRVDIARVVWTQVFPAERLGIYPRVAGIFADGSLLLSGGESDVFYVSPVPVRAPLRLVRFSFAAPRLDTLRSERGREEFTWGGTRSATRRPAPFARETFVAVRGSRLWVADNERYEVRVYSAGGRLARIIRRIAPATPVSDSARQAIRDDFVRRARSTYGADSALRIAERLPFPSTLPAFAGLLVGRGGETWLRHGDPGHESTWTVFDRDGRLLGDVSLPPDLDVLEIGDDYVLGKWSAGPGGERVRLYRLKK